MSFWFWAFVVLLFVLMGFITIDFDGIVNKLFELIDMIIVKS